VSLRTITAIVQAAAQRAQSWLVQQVPGQGRVVALDEQYSSKRGEAYLNVVDVHSSRVWASLHLAGQVQARLERVVQAEEERWLVIK
jgi:hypothetical protein